MATWQRKPSLAGRRLALQRKFEVNYLHYGGGVGMGTITAPGADLLPWDTDLCTHAAGEKCSGEKGCKVEWIYAHVYEATAQARMSRLWEAAARSADRHVRRMWGGQLPVQLSNVRSPQLRGVSHFHYGLPQGTEVERAWSRHVRRFIEHQVEREKGMSIESRWEAIEKEWRTGEVTRGVYGFGHVKFGAPRRQHGRAGAGGNVRDGGRLGAHSAATPELRAASVARYQARNAAGYQAQQAGATRHYITTRLTRETGVTMRNLRRLNYLHVRRMLIASGELEDGEFPSFWADDVRAEVLRVEAVCRAAAGP